MPKSSETAARTFFGEYPRFRDDERPSGRRATEGETNAARSTTPTTSTAAKPRATPRWDYVEGPVENIVPHGSTLLVGIHACGRLSDTIIDLAISSGAPLALVPCCHSRKMLTPSQEEGYEAILSGTRAPAIGSTPALSTTACTTVPRYSLADFADALRKQRLIDAGYDVREVSIPEEFTPKNRVLLAMPGPPAAGSPGRAGPPAALGPPPNKKGKTVDRSKWGIRYFPIPLADTPEARESLRSIAGREAAEQRKAEAFPPPAICVSVWLPDPGEGGAGTITAGALQRAILAEEEAAVATPSGGNDKAKNHNTPTVRVEEAGHKPYTRPSDGRSSKTFRVHYLDCRNNKARARERHGFLKEVVLPGHFPRFALRG